MPGLSREEAAKLAMESTAPPKVGFGQITQFDFGAVVYNADTRRYDEYDSDKHKISQAQASIVIIVDTLRRTEGRYDAKRNYIDSNKQGNEWREITRPSLSKLKLGEHNAVGTYVRYEMRRTGRSWPSTDKNGNEITVHGETFYFTNVFRSEEDMLAAHAEYLLSSGFSSSGDQSNGSTGAAAEPESDDPVVRSLHALYRMSGNSDDAFSKAFNGNKVMNKAKGGRWTLEQALDIVHGNAAAEPGAAVEAEDIPF